jgi:hypothetical protein
MQDTKDWSIPIDKVLFVALLSATCHWCGAWHERNNKIIIDGHSLVCNLEALTTPRRVIRLFGPMNSELQFGLVSTLEFCTKLALSLVT